MAAPQAFDQAGCDYAEVDFMVFATWTPDVTFPGAGCYLQDQLGGGTTPAMDIRAQCAGFLFGLSIADQFVRTGVYRRVLLATAEVHSAALDYSARGSQITPLFGDGSAVAIVGPSSGKSYLRSIVLHTDGRRHKDFWCEYPASRQHPTRMTEEAFDAGRHFPRIDLDGVRASGLETLPRVTREALEKAGVGTADVDHFVFAHILPEVSEATGGKLGIPSTRTTVAGVKHGHLGAAALPVALSEALRHGAISRGATVCLATCGAGSAWGAALITI
jgi:3-oxoacyl-[acyl-carrier-protein] synthase-3